MNDENEFDEGPPSDDFAAPKKSKGPVVMVVIGLAALAGGAGLTVKATGTPEDKGEQQDGDDAASGAKMGPIVELDTFIVNLADPDELHYLKCTVALELTEAKWQGQIDQQLVRVRHAVLLYLSSLTMEDTHGVDNKNAIQKALHESVAAITGENVVEAIYLTAFVIQ